MCVCVVQGKVLLRTDSLGPTLSEEGCAVLVCQASQLLKPTVLSAIADKLVVSGNFDAAGDLDVPLFRASWLGWNSMAWLPFFRTLMGQIQDTLEGECLLHIQEFFPHEVIILPRRHLAMMEECGLELVVEKYTGMVKDGSTSSTNMSRVDCQNAVSFLISKKDTQIWN